MHSFRLFILTLAVAVCTLPAFAQHPKPEELKAEVPALEAMHEVIMPMWHDAWPKKDTKALAAATPEIEKHLAAVQAAKLPGILRDKQPAWDDGVRALASGVAAYKTAARANDGPALLSAAERVHMQYERLVRLVNPVVPEVDAFHQTLYVVYHYQMGKFSLPEIAVSAKELDTKMQALQRATLPDRMKAKAPAFDAARNDLATSVAALQISVRSGVEAPIKAAIEDVHAKYEVLESVFR
jgi:hypothetical protein